MLQHGIEGIRAHLATLPPMREQTVEEAREMYDKAQYVFSLPEGVEVETDDIGGVPAEVVTPAEHGAGTLLYFHGGGYAIGSPASHRHLVGALAAASRARAFALDYRRAPEHPFPAAVDDAPSPDTAGCSMPASLRAPSSSAAIRPVAASPSRP